MPRRPEGTSEGYMKKITVNGIGCNPAIAKTSEKPVPCMRVWGFASSLHSDFWDKESPGRGKWTCLVGEFQAVNMQSPEKDLYESAWLFLPEGIQDVIQIQVEKCIKDGGGEVMFALELQAVKSNNQSGYSWRAVNLRPIQKTDTPLAKLRAEIGFAPAALPAPEEKKPAAAGRR